MSHLRRASAVVIALAVGAGIGALGYAVINGDGDNAAPRPSGRRTTATLPAKRYEPARFVPVRSLTLGRGWRLNIDSAAIFQISRAAPPSGSIGFDRPAEILEDRFASLPDAQRATAKVQPLPADIGEYFRSLPEVEVTPSQPATVAGVTGESFFVRLRPLPPENQHLCEPARRCMLYARRGPQLFALFENDVTEFTVLRVRGETLLIAVAAPEVRFGEFRALAQNVVRTVRLRTR